MGVHKAGEIDMGFLQYFHQGTKIVNILLSNEERNLRDRKEEYKGYKIIAVVGTIIVLALCIGAMYIRFRVFGG